MGYLTEAEFINIVMKNLPPIVKSDLESSGYKTEIHKYNNPILEFSYWKDLIKNFRRGSFVYEEYDGTIHMTEDCEKNKDYQRLIRLNRHPIRLKIKPEEYLSLGDKDWLSYHCSYSVKLTKPLTKEYALEIAKKFHNPCEDTCDFSRERNRAKQRLARNFLIRRNPPVKK